MAERMGIPTETFRSIETGRTTVSVERLVEMAGALDVTVVDLLVIPGVGEPAPEVVVTVTRHYCERCLGKWGNVEGLVRADLAALDGVIGLNRGLAEMACTLAAAMDECPDPSKLTMLSRELRIVMDKLTERVTPQPSGRNAPARGGGGGGDLGDLGMPVLSA